MKENKTYTLFELNRLVRQSIELTLQGDFWVEAELSEARESNGHCYMELIQKDERGNTPVARASAKCWRSTWLSVRPDFERVTGMKLRAGIKVLLRVYPQFHEAYGFSWIVSGIDPTYTLGDMARRRMEIIKTLKDEGVFDLNKQLSFPRFAQRIAVISSATAAGYGDFCDQLANNPYGFAFITTLFPATMQGEGVEQSIIARLNGIYDCVEDFDCVVIIRGGGASSDLSGFDSLPLAENIANFPLPVITGIGHDRDETIADMVAHSRVKTPTAAAALLIDNLCDTAARIQNAQQRIYDKVKATMQREEQRIARLSQLIPTMFSLVSNRQQSRIDMLLTRMKAAAMRRVTDERHRIELLSQRTSALDPQILLQRGYSITTINGKAVKDAADLAEGDEIETRFAKGKVKSTVSESR